jgi:hypothetical protein
MFKFSTYTSSLALLCGTLLLSSCKKDEPATPQYEVPATYNFTGADFSTSSNRIKMAVELNTYLSSGNTSTQPLDQVRANNLFNNTNAPFANAELNTSGVSLAEKTADVATYQGFINQHVALSSFNTRPASDGTAGFITRNFGKILVGPQGLEYNQAFAKGTMGSIFFKEAMTILAGIANTDNGTVTNGTTAMQRNWDEAFGYLGIPVNYDSSKVYPGTDPVRPLLWGSYLAERGRSIKAGGILFEAFRKGRAAIGFKDYPVRDQQVKIIQETWERLAAASALAYVTIPQASSSVGKLETQLHALSEGYGFVLALKYRPAGSKLSDANYQRLLSILTTNFYTLVNEAGFTRLKEAEAILKTTYNL